MLPITSPAPSCHPQVSPCSSLLLLPITVIYAHGQPTLVYHLPTFTLSNTTIHSLGPLIPSSLLRVGHSRHSIQPTNQMLCPSPRRHLTPSKQVYNPGFTNLLDQAALLFPHEPSQQTTSMTTVQISLLVLVDGCIVPSSYLPTMVRTGR